MDITYPLDEHLLIYPGDPVFKTEAFLSMDEGASCNVTNLTMGLSYRHPYGCAAAFSGRMGKAWMP